MFEGEYVLVSLATGRAVDRSQEIGDIFDTVQNLDVRGLVVRMKDFVYNKKRTKLKFRTVAELPAEDFLNASDPFRALITKGRTNG